LPYSVALIWINHVQAEFPDLTLQVLATDANETMLQRAERASYPASSLKQLPADWKQKAFTPNNGEYQLAPQFRSLVQFRQADIRVDQPAELFSLIVCRNLVFTYFDEPLQRQVLAWLSERLLPGGYLVIGKHESLPATTGLIPDPARLGFFRLD
jgi:chemotaxis protein methyltransferase CheR